MQRCLSKKTVVKGVTVTTGDNSFQDSCFIKAHMVTQEQIWKLEYDTAQLRHVTVGETVGDDVLPLHVQVNVGKLLRQDWSKSS